MNPVNLLHGDGHADVLSAGLIAGIEGEGGGSSFDSQLNVGYNVQRGKRKISIILSAI